MTMSYKSSTIDISNDIHSSKNSDSVPIPPLPTTCYHWSSTVEATITKEDDEYTKFVKSLSRIPKPTSTSNTFPLYSSHTSIPDNLFIEDDLQTLADLATEEEDDDVEEYNSDDIEEEEDNSTITHSGSFGTELSQVDIDTTETMIPPILELDRPDPVVITTKNRKTNKNTPDLLDNIELNSPEFYAALEEELGSLLEEDCEAAMESLLDTHVVGSDSLPSPSKPSLPTKITNCIIDTRNIQKNHTTSPLQKISENDNDFKPISTSVSLQNPVPTTKQMHELRKLLNHHYQFLIQQMVLAVRAAHGHKIQRENTISGYGSEYHHNLSGNIPRIHKEQNESDEKLWLGGETSDELAEILDSTVGMLQDLERQRRDGVRYSIQMRRSNHKRKYESKTEETPSQDKKLNGRNMNFPSLSPLTNTYPTQYLASTLNINDSLNDSFSSKRLTRSIFDKQLREQDRVSEWANNLCQTAQTTVNGISLTTPVGEPPGQSSHVWYHTIFDVRGLARLEETFKAIDTSVSCVDARDINCQESVNILTHYKHSCACEMLLLHARAEFDMRFIPYRSNLALFLSYPNEVMNNGNNTRNYLTNQEQMELRKNRTPFTAAEDNLLLRGVNLYGEREWLLISDRYLPDRSVSIISQRYARLCLLLYKRHGIFIDEQGNLETAPEHTNGIEDFNEEEIAKLTPVLPPANFNVHRWSLEEDITLLQAVPLMGHMWAEVSNRLISHRDRGHLRKRYQVLERRVKATVKRKNKTKSVKKSSNLNTSNKADKPLPTTPPITRGKKYPTTTASLSRNQKLMSLLNHCHIVRNCTPVYGFDDKPRSQVHPIHVNQPPPDASPNFHMINHVNNPDHFSQYHLVKPELFQTINEAITPICVTNIINDNDSWSHTSSVCKLIEGNDNNTVKFKVENSMSGMSNILPHSTDYLSEYPNITPKKNKKPKNTFRKLNKSIMSSILCHTKENTKHRMTTTSNYHFPGESYTTLSSNKQTPSNLRKVPLSHYPKHNSNTTTIFHPESCPNGGMGMYSAPISSGCSVDGYNFSNFTISEESKKAFFRENGRLHSTSNFSQTFPNNSNSIYVGSSFMDSTDLDAISALNQMSNSIPYDKHPPKVLYSEPVEYNDKYSSYEFESKTLGETSSTSLFAKVLGEIKGKESKKKD